MIMFCVSCVRISKHFKNMRTLLGEKEEQIDHISKGGLWSLGHAAFIQFYDLLCQTYGGTMISSFIVLFLKSMWSPFNSIYEVQWASGDASPLCIYTARGLSFLSIVAFGEFAERAADLNDCGHLLSWTHTTPGRALWHTLGIMQLIASRFTECLKDDVASDPLPCARILKGGDEKSGFSQDALESVSVGFTSRLWKGCMNRLYRCCV